MHWLSPIIIYWARRQSAQGWRATPEPTVTGWQIRCLQEPLMEGSDFLLAGVLFLFAAVLRCRWHRGWVLVQCWDICWRDCDWPVGAGVY